MPLTGAGSMMRRQTRVAVDGEAWLINGDPTWRQREYRGWPIEGLLLNSRMANAIFDDANPANRFLWRYPDTGRWDADRNTDEFVRALPVYREHGLTAVTVNLQGGAPFGYYREDRVSGVARRATGCLYRRRTVARAAGPGLPAVAQLAVRR